MGYRPGLDGVRALAVLAVVLYHLGTTGGWRSTPGGFLGVDVFFVLSGYLITGLLVAEHRRQGRIGLGRFYLRRARRLLPALYLLLAAVVAVGTLLPAQAHRLRGDVPAALAYVTNWWLIWQDRSYFGNGSTPPLLDHLWSLAVEEQFYLLWPVALIGLLALGRGRTWPALVAASAGVIGSTVAMALLYSPWQDTGRVYFGTDTRAAALLVGAALALAPIPRDFFAIGGLVGLVALVASALWLPAGTPELYRAGFLGVALASAMLVGAAAHPSLPLARVLGLAPLRFIGLRSYAIYLWHWPVLVLLGPKLLAEPMLSVARVAIVLLLAHASYHLVELPIRRGALGRLWRSPRHRFALATAVLVLVAALGTQLFRFGDTPPPSIAQDPRPGITLAPFTPAGPTGSPTPAPSSAAPAAPPFAPPIRVGVFGDSQGMTLLLNKPANVGRYLTVSDQTAEGCGVLTDRIASRSGERRDLAGSCGGWLGQWTSRARNLRPQLALVMIGAWDVFDRSGPAPVLAFGSPAWDRHFTAALGSAVAALRAAGAQVVLSLLPCYRPVDKPGSGWWPERGDDSRTRHVNVLLKALAVADPRHVFTVDPPARFCGDLARNLDYRWDGVHYYKPGSALYFQTVIPQLLAVPGPGAA